LVLAVAVAAASDKQESTYIMDREYPLFFLFSL
jgi:hypothetical protein